jgi:hypothetical protein
VISLVIKFARFGPDGAIAPTVRGLQASARKNNKRLCAAIRVSHPSHQPHHPLMSAWTRYEGWVLREHCASPQQQEFFDLGRDGSNKTADKSYDAG